MDELVIEPLKSYLGRMKAKGECPARKPMHKIVWSWVGAFIGIYAIGRCGQLLATFGHVETMFLIGSFGASAVLTYGAPLAEFSQPRNLVLGHVVSALMGVTVFHFVPGAGAENVVFAGALAVACAIAAMHLTRSLHPPGGATALIAVIGSEKVHQLGYLYVLMPVAVGAVILLLVALLVNNLSVNPKRHYPVYWY